MVRHMLHVVLKYVINDLLLEAALDFVLGQLPHLLAPLLQELVQLIVVLDEYHPPVQSFLRNYLLRLGEEVE